MGGYIGATAVGLTTTAADVQGDITSTDTTPELILKNTSEEDTEGGREGKITFKGEQSGGEESTLAQIESAHDGTSDDEKGDLIFKTNDGSDGATPTERMRIDSNGSILTATLGTDNVHLGEGAGASIASGGNNNVAIGKDAGTALTTGDQNVLVGQAAGDALTTSSNNVAIGNLALSADTLGGRSVAIGASALATQNFTSSTNAYNTAIGFTAGTSVTTGTNNTLIGALAGDAITTGSNNVAIGYEALTAQTTGDRNIGIGSSAGAAITTGQGSIAIGHQALASATTGDDNVAIGCDSPTVNAALEANTTGVQSTAVGGGALAANTTANEGTAVGYKALNAVTTGFGNTAVGGNAGKAMTTNDRSTFVGNLTGADTTGRANSFFGCDAGYLITSGAKNTIIGRYNGNQDSLDLRTSSDNIVLSSGDGSVRCHIDSSGAAQFKGSGASMVTGNNHSFAHDNNDTPAFVINEQHGSFVSKVAFIACDRSASSAYHILQTRSGGTGGDIEFYVRGDGQVYADGSFNGGGADYAEYFEWADGNSSNQDRTGYTVVLDNEKVRLATSDDNAANIIGAVSANPSVVGDSDIEQWKHKYQRDDFGGFVWETYTVTEWTETVVDQEATDEKEEITREVFHNYESDKIPDGITAPDDATVSTQDADGNTFKRKVLNTDYNPDTAYVSREDRQEWATIGMMGKLRIRKGQPTGDRWIKMRDISDTVEEWLVR